MRSPQYAEWLKFAASKVAGAIAFAFFLLISLVILIFSYTFQEAIDERDSKDLDENDADQCS